MSLERLEEANRTITELEHALQEEQRMLAEAEEQNRILLRRVNQLQDKLDKLGGKKK